MDNVEGVIADIEGQRVGKGQLGRVRSRVIRVPDEPDAVRIGLLEALAFLFEGAERIEIALEAFLELDLPDDRHVRKIRVARDMVAVRLGVDQIADRRLVFHALAPAHRVDRLLRRIDHDIAVAGLDKARIAAGEIDFGKRILPYPAHRPLLFSCFRSGTGYSAATGIGARWNPTRAPPAHNRLNSSSAATTTSTSSGLPASIIMP